jgi:hypothetical protein
VEEEGANEGSILTAYARDDKAVWKELGRELVREGYSSSLEGAWREACVDEPM